MHRYMSNPEELPVLAEPPVAKEEAPPTPSEMERRAEAEKLGGGGEVVGVTANLTVAPDGCRGQAIYVMWGGAGQEEAPTDHGRQGSPEGIPPDW